MAIFPMKWAIFEACVNFCRGLTKFYTPKLKYFLLKTCNETIFFVNLQHKKIGLFNL